MADHITDEMVVTAIEAFTEEPLTAGRKGWWRAALAAVAPLIRAQAFKEAAMVTSSVLESQGIEDGEAVEILNICADEIRALMTENANV